MTIPNILDDHDCILTMDPSCSPITKHPILKPRVWLLSFWTSFTIHLTYFQWGDARKWTWCGITSHWANNITLWYVYTNQQYIFYSPSHVGTLCDITSHWANGIMLWCVYKSIREVFHGWDIFFALHFAKTFIMAPSLAWSTPLLPNEGLTFNDAFMIYSTCFIATSHSSSCKNIIYTHEAKCNIAHWNLTPVITLLTTFPNHGWYHIHTTLLKSMESITWSLNFTFVSCLISLCHTVFVYEGW